MERRRFLVLILLASLLGGGCASSGRGEGVPPGMREFYVPEVYEGLYGTWVNPDYRPPGPAARLILHPSGLLEGFAEAADTDPQWIGTSIIVERWTSDGGDTWYKEYRRYCPRDCEDSDAFVLARVSPDETLLESIEGAEGWPTPAELGPGLDPTYVRYRRLR